MIGVGENVNRVFYEDVKEKRTTARGVHGKKGTKGTVGKMITPADIAGREYRQAKDLATFNIYDLIHKLHETPTLKSVVLSRMEEEYQNYRQALEKNLDAVAELLKIGLEPVYEELIVLQQRLDDLSLAIRNLPAGENSPDAYRNAVMNVEGEPATSGGRRKRIRWGSNPEGIRETVFAQLQALLEEGEEISTETIKKRIPSMLRWIYGEKAVFNGIEGLRQEFLHAASAATAAATTAATAPEPVPIETEEELA